MEIISINKVKIKTNRTKKIRLGTEVLNLPFEDAKNDDDIVIGYINGFKTKKKTNTYLRGILHDYFDTKEVLIPIFNKKFVGRKIIGYIPISEKEKIVYTKLDFKYLYISLLTTIILMSTVFKPQVKAVMTTIFNSISKIVIYNINDDEVLISGNSHETETQEAIYNYDNSSTNDSSSLPSVIVDGITYQGDYLEISSSDYIPLGNNNENIGYQLKFIIKENNEVIYSTAKVSSGDSVHWFPSKYLSKGIHNLDVYIEVYVAGNDISTGVNACMPISVKIM